MHTVATGKLSEWENPFKSCQKFQYFLKFTRLIQFLGITENGHQICQPFLASLNVGNVLRTSLQFFLEPFSDVLPEWKKCGHRNDRSLSSVPPQIGAGVELHTREPSPKLHNSHCVFPTKVTELHGRQQWGCFLERTPETKLYNS